MTLRDIDRAIATLRKEHAPSPQRDMAEGHLFTAKACVEKMEQMK